VPDYNLGTARGVIEIEYKGDGARKATEDLKGAGSAAQDQSAKVNKAGNQLAGAGAVIAGGLALAVKSAANFETRLSAVQAVSGASASEMQQLRDKSLQLGKDTQFSASESAAAIEELVKAGVSVADVMNGAADATVALAAAGGVSMPEAAAISSNAMNQFNLAAKDLPRVADLIAGAANASAIDVKEFGYSLSQVGAVANLAGATFDDTATAIALMGNAGIKGSDAGTSLKTMLQNLQPQTKKQITLFKELGLTAKDGSNAFYDQQGNLKSLSSISGTLQKSLKGMTAQQKQATLETLFGSDAIRGAAILANNGSKGFDKMSASMSKVKAADVAKTRMDNLQGSIEQLKGSLETLMIQVGTPLLKFLRSIVDGVTGLINKALDVPGPIREVIGVFAAVLSGGLLLVGMFLKAKAAFTAFRAGAMLITGPIGLIVLAIAALVAAFIYFYKNNAGFKEFVDKTAAAIKNGLAKAITFILPYLKQFGQFMMRVFKAALPYIMDFARAVVPALKAFGGFLISSFQKALPYIMRFIAAIVSLKPMVMDFINSSIALGKALITFFAPAISFIVSALKILAGVFVGTILPLFLRVGQIVAQVFGKTIVAVFTAAIGIIRGALNIIIGIIKIFTGLLTGNWSKAWEGVKQVLRGVVGVIGSLLRGLLSTAGAILKGLGQILLAGIKAIPGLLKGAGKLFAAAGRFLLDQFANGMKSAAGLIQGIASNVWNFVRGLLNGAIGSINAALEFTIDPPGPGTISINPPDIPKLASGAVISAPTMAWVGEGTESEAVTPLSELWATIDRVYKAGQRSAATVPAASSRDASSGSSSGSSELRLVSGTLGIDPSGRAYIQGVAQEVVDGTDNYAGTLSRMGSRS
jgi:TP901 family phage tail tape measure protein